MQTIKRKTLLYKSNVGGMDYCINHVLGCSHGCKYPCYAFSMKRSYGQVQSYEEWCAPRIVSNALELLDKELARISHRIRTVHLCFSTDPFMYGYPEISEMSLNIIKRVNSAGIPCSVLTKGILPEELADNKDFSRKNEYAVSIVSLDEDFRKKWEPGSAPYKDRVDALRRLHDKGCSTWVHMEPYPTPNIVRQDLREILEAVSFVKSISFGGWNYSPLVRQYKGYKQFYLEQGKIVEEFCRKRSLHCDVL